MEQWVMYALISWLLLWIAIFILKLTAHWKYNKERIIFFWNVVTLFITWSYLILNYKYVEISIFIFLLILIRVIAAAEKNLFIIESLKYLETSLFFPIHKILHIFASLIIWIIFFWEYLSFTQYIAVWLGVIMVLLISDKEWRKKQLDYKKGVIYLLLANFALLFASYINKYISVNDFDIATYLFYSSVFGSLYFILKKRKIYEKVENKKLKNEIFYWVTRWIFLLWGFTFTLLALKEWPMVLVWIINSISIFIPIILAVLIYDEKITFKKLLSLIIFVIIIVILGIF